MPTTVNGIGTTYIGRRNVQSYPGVCASCGTEIMLEDYETSLFFCFIFIPLIPLGRKQIIGHCHSCTRHQAMSVDEWQRLKDDAINTGMAALAAAPDDATTALELVGTLEAFHERGQALDLANATQSQHGDDADVQLELGAWFEQGQHISQANACFDRAFEIDPEHPGAVRARGLTLLEKGQVEQAHAMLDKLLPPSPGYDPVLFFMLATVYQDTNQHDQAMKLFELIQQNSPDFAKEKEFKKALKKTRKIVG